MNGRQKNHSYSFLGTPFSYYDLLDQQVQVVTFQEDGRVLGVIAAFFSSIFFPVVPPRFFCYTLNIALFGFVDFRINFGTNYSPNLFFFLEEKLFAGLNLSVTLTPK